MPYPLFPLPGCGEGVFIILHYELLKPTHMIPPLFPPLRKGEDEKTRCRPSINIHHTLPFVRGDDSKS
jgi:hypothetical protein